MAQEARPRPPSRLAGIATGSQQIEILREPDDVLPFIEDVQSSADSDTSALGFLPPIVYQNAVTKRNLFVAICNSATGAKYCGHAWFGGKFPIGRIFQVSVSPSFRRRGVGSMLIAAVVELMEKHGYKSIRARVASDLDANKFWEKHRFEILQQRPGGSASGRVLNIRIRILDTETLFGYFEGEPVSDIPLIDQSTSRLPVYAIDLNVLFDLVRHRQRFEAAARLFSSGFNNLLQLVVTEEFVAELERTRDPTKHDPILEFAAQIPTLPRPRVESIEQAMMDIGSIVFPERSLRQALTQQDRSDLIHLATSIHHNVTGFITSERAIVKNADLLRAQYGIEIVDLLDFATLLQATGSDVRPVDAQISGDTLHIASLGQEDTPELNRLFENLGIRSEWLTGPSLSRSPSIAITSEGKLLCAAIWSRSDSLTRKLRAEVIADEGHPAAETALDALLLRLCREARGHGPALVQLVVPIAALTVQDVARQFGFSAGKSDSRSTVLLQRITIGYPVVSSGWGVLLSDLKEFANASLPPELPVFSGSDSRMRFHAKGREFRISLSDLETILSPVIFVLPNRAATLVPIQRVYADALLGTSRQRSLLPAQSAGIFHRRVYYSSSRNAGLLRKGTPLVFYESGQNGGRSAAVALARTIESVLVPKGAVSSKLLQYGVLDQEEIATLTEAEQMTVTTFDNVMELATPVPLRRLRDLRCADPICPRTLTPSQFEAIVSEGTVPNA